MTTPKEIVWVACTALALFAVIYCYHRLSQRQEENGAASLEQQVLPQSTTAYIRAGYILVNLTLASGIAAIFSWLCWQVSPIALSITAPCAFPISLAPGMPTDSLID